ncbi:uncharacterized protein [Physcomitrium patens]|uniref:tRNA-splicing endonuclease subunit Sen54 N-terminal domain-containing protein n=1 Tax=Physcomitrium patens TaxID=3218 RepID=A0A7I4DK98_PHYPA|nr:tRNA-splicing endonuclease subunit Sen54-like isoform X1 [Physcomitrium patens]|eukprot:XP_024370577.1 tRNA-splicing endonuclease subunit Sen54-like isoform X1 [Physcomitrella patens]
MRRADVDYGSDGSGASELSDDDSYDYGGVDDTRLRFRKDLSVAQWDAERGIAEVVVKKGKAWIVTGFTRGSRHAIFIEEAVFMVEQGSLLLREGERVVDLLEAYSLVSTPSYGCSWNNYQVYSYLKKLGYIVGRHNVPWTVSKKRPPMPADEVESITSQFAAVKTSEGTQETNTACSQLVDSKSAPGFEVNTELQGSESSSEMKLMYDVHLPNARFKKSNPGLPAFSLCTTSSRPPHRLQVRALALSLEGRPLKFASVVSDHVSIYSFDTIELPNLP